MTEEDLLVKTWSEAYGEEVLEFTRPERVSNEEVFAEIYHSLIHSRVISNALVQLEHSHARTVEEKIEKIRKISEEQKSKNLTPEEQLLLESRFASDLSNVRETQYREFREWVARVHEEFQEEEESGGSFGKSESSFSLEAVPSAPILQESFTVTLGAQMKQMHNIRLVAADVLDLCTYPSSLTEDGSSSLPQRLQTSMSLYSDSVSGIVLLNDEALSSVVNRSTEFHFLTYEQQLENIFSKEVKGKCLEWRQERIKKKKLSRFADQEKIDEKKEDCTDLRNGDFFITKHSNLCEVHVLFHMKSDDSALSGNINSRHPVVMGLRNVLKTASLSDVTTVTLPLLLASEMNEVMTVQWCMKRAELVFKCVKGFMMEVSSWGGSDIKTLQFLVPKEIDKEVFYRLAGMVSGIFRTSNPIRGM